MNCLEWLMSHSQLFNLIHSPSSNLLHVYLVVFVLLTLAPQTWNSWRFSWKAWTGSSWFEAAAVKLSPFTPKEEKWNCFFCAPNPAHFGACRPWFGSAGIFGVGRDLFFPLFHFIFWFGFSVVQFFCRRGLSGKRDHLWLTHEGRQNDEGKPLVCTRSRWAAVSPHLLHLADRA